MEPLNARPSLLKQVNLSMIRKVLTASQSVTRAELAAETGISSTTVRSLLTEMLESGEIERAGLDESRGGRKAERYRLNRSRCFGAAFCISNREIQALLVNACGEVVETASLSAPEEDYEKALSACLDEWTGKTPIKAIGVGVPGAVDGGGYWRKNPVDGNLYRSDLGDALARRYGLTVALENDVNATAIGFGRCYEREFPAEHHEDTNMAYLHFEAGCVSAGFIAGGRIIRGAHNFAGELGLAPMGRDCLLDERMALPMDEARYNETLIQIIGWVCGILNPQYVALGGPAFRRECLGPVGDGLSALLPAPLLPELLYAPDARRDYQDGMASLTAGKIFGAVQFVRE